MLPTSKIKGAICMDCHETIEGRAIVFLLDGSESVGQDGWDKQLQFMRTIANSIQNIRTGVVFISNTPTIELHMNHYTKADLE
ncbi:hypothetical protein Y032_0426g1245 [Ancylostoma ceylanicum]|nr:hypothetical protein Y032_0426g1245 [Ancylostoma ceylanicum]